MKKLNLTLFVSLLCLTSYAADIPEKEITTTVEEVTVFLQGAQVTRKITIEIEQGESVLKFTKLSPFIEAKSIQVKADGPVTVMSVNHQQNYLDQLDKSEKLTDLGDELKALDEKIKLERTYLSILTEELAFLEENRSIGGRDAQISVTNLKEAADFYSTRLTALKLDEIKRQKTVSELQQKRTNLVNQINTLSSKEEYPAGEILIKIKAEQAVKVPVTVTYLVHNAGWFPTYDIRAENINEPLEITYKANVRQDTKVDWNNVQLRFSSTEPNVSGVAPVLKTYYLDYNSQPPKYDENISSVSGVVTNGQGEPLVGANVVVNETTVGTVTDANGKFSLTLPDNATHLAVSFIGYETKEVPVSSKQMRIILQESIQDLQEVTFASETISTIEFRDNYASSATGVRIQKGRTKPSAYESLPIPFSKIEKQTSVDFEIQTPYTIKSDNKSYTVDMVNYAVPAEYQYYAVPKIEETAYLLANIVEWEQYNLLEGEATIFFEGTYVGKSILDVRYVSDTLQLSLGRDKNVSVHREKVKDFTQRQFIGNKKEETRAWRILVKNNKSQKIDIRVMDQVPVSTLEEIEIDVQKTSGASHKQETGNLTWMFSLKPGEEESVELRYSVKYPKHRNLVIE
ncbi:MAG: DUF4139 domain-containing protein [Bacteroidota bacterium]